MASVRRYRTAGRFFRTPKGLLLIVFAILAALAIPKEGIKLVGAGLAASVLAAGLLDLFILRIRKQAWEFPSGAILTGLIVSMVLSSHEPWYVEAATSAVAVISSPESSSIRSGSCCSSCRNALR